MGAFLEALHPSKPRKLPQKAGASLHPGAAKSMPFLRRLHTFNDPKFKFPRLKSDVTRINAAFPFC